MKKLLYYSRDALHDGVPFDLEAALDRDLGLKAPPELAALLP